MNDITLKALLCPRSAQAGTNAWGLGALQLNLQRFLLKNILQSHQRMVINGGLLELKAVWLTVDWDRWVVPVSEIGDSAVYHPVLGPHIWKSSLPMKVAGALFTANLTTLPGALKIPFWWYRIWASGLTMLFPKTMALQVLFQLRINPPAHPCVIPASFM